MDFEWSDENLLRTCFKVEILGDSIGTMLRGRLGISGSGYIAEVFLIVITNRRLQVATFLFYFDGLPYPLLGNF